MTNKKELKEEELVAVSGGASSDPNKLTWLNAYGNPIKIRKSHSYELLDGIVEKRGYYSIYNFYFPAKYVSCSSNPNYSRWYLDESSEWVREVNSKNESDITEKPW